MKTRIVIAFLFLSSSIFAGNIYYLQSVSNTWQGKPSDKVITSTSTSSVSKLAEGDEIWITGGDYTLDNSGVNNVTVRGGFAGTENNPDERDGKHITSITNDINQTGWNFDGFTFKMSVFLKGDVFVINSIISNYNDQTICPLHIEGSSPQGVLVENCWFYNNNTKRGALWCYHGIVSSCSFVNNHSRYAAGALWCEYDVLIENCFFYGNTEGVSYTPRDIYAGYSYASERNISGNLISTKPYDYSTNNTQYNHSDSYIKFSADKCTLLQNDASPFVDKGSVSIEDFPIKTIWGTPRFCDKIDIGCAEFQKAYAKLYDITVSKPSFIKEEGWSVKDTDFVIVSGLECFYPPLDTVEYEFAQGNAFAVRNWHFKKVNCTQGSCETDREWDLSKGNVVRYELDDNPFDSLLITATQAVDTFQLKLYVPNKSGVNATAIRVSEYNTSLAPDSQSAMVYVGEEVTLKVDYDSDHYHFDGWYIDNNFVSNQAEYIYKVSSDTPFGRNEQVVYAYVVPNTMDVSYKVMPDNSYGSVVTEPSSLSSVVYGDSVAFYATPAAGKEFKHWIDSCEVKVDTIYDSQFKAEIVHNHVYKAMFEDIKYNVDVHTTINGERQSDVHKGIKSLTGGGQFLYNESTSLKIETLDGYEFRGWLCPAISIDTLKSNPYSLSNIKKDYEFEACLKRVTYKVTASVEPADWPVTITQSNEDGIYFLGDTVVITVSDTVRMDSWQKRSGDSWKKYAAACSQIEVYDIDKAYEFRAVYNPELMLLDLKSADDSKGSVSYSGSLTLNSDVTVSAEAEEGYDFDYWETATGTLYEPAEFTFKITQDTTLIAHFAPKQFKVTTTAKIINHTELEADDYVKYDPLVYVQYDSAVVLTPECAEGFDVVGWIVNGSDTIKGNELVLSQVQSDKDVTLFVSHRVVRVLAYAFPLDAGFEVHQANESGLYYYGESATITADSSRYLMAWHVFNGENWVGYKGGQLEDITKLTIDSLNGSMIIRAFYNMSMRFINFEVSDPEYGYVEYETKNFGYFCFGDTCTVTAYTYEDPKGKFVRWTSGDQVLSEQNPLVFRIETDSTIVANFAPDEPTEVIEEQEELNSVDNKDKPYKTIIDNQIVIIAGGRKFNLLGVELKE